MEHLIQITTRNYLLKTCLKKGEKCTPLQILQFSYSFFNLSVCQFRTEYSVATI